MSKTQGIKKEVDGTQILIPDVPSWKDSYYTRKKKHKLFYKRARIEQTIGHLQSDLRLGYNFYKGVFGDAVNLLLAAAMYNFKRAMRVLGLLIENNMRDTVFLQYPAKEHFLRNDYII